jgi:two-component system chemotaxis sensor kinase CheA
MDMSQYRGLFLSEAREHLNAMNGLVIALEQEPADRATIDALFREAHSIKGMAAAMGFEQTARLAHHLEDSLDDFRQAGRVPAAAVNRLLDGLDLLEDLVDDIDAGRPERDVSVFLEENSGQVPVAEIEATSDRLTAEEIGCDPDDIPLVSLEELEQDDPVEAGDAVVNPVPVGRSEGLADAEGPAVSAEPDTFQVLVSLAEDAAAPAARGLLLLRELEKRGEIVSADPGKEALLAGAPCRQIKVWLRTILEKEHVKELLLVFPDVARVEFVADRRREAAAKREEAARSVRVRTDLLDRFVNLTGELLTHRHVLWAAAKGRDWDEMRAALDQMSKLVDDLHHHVLRTRLVPLESIAGRLPRVVRDLGRKAGKQVTFRLVGGDVGLDRVILDELADPLLHLVRNAVDHGIRDKGEVMVSARRERDMVVVEVRDDGVGMDPSRLREKAVEQGMLTPAQAENLADRAALMLVCRPGFSTADAVTETSGRGVGMDVVKSAVEDLGGTLNIRSMPDEGTCFQLRLPLSIAIIKLILVRCAGFALALPVTRVQRILELPREALQMSDGQGSFLLEEERVRFVSLASALGLEASPLEETVCIVLAELHGRLIGLQVDGFLGHRDAYVKSLGFPLNLLEGLSGAAIEGDGSVRFVIDPQPLLGEELPQSDA